METTIAKYRGFGKAAFVTLAMAAVVAAASLTALLRFAEPAQAHQEDNYPLHMTEPFRCSTDGTVYAKAPFAMGSYSGGLENVRWKAELYRWNGSSWDYLNTTDLYQAGVNKYGLMPSNGQTGGAIWTNMRTGFPIKNDQVFAWGGLPRGSYTIVNHYTWVAAGVTHSEQGYYNSGIQYCTI